MFKLAIVAAALFVGGACGGDDPSVAVDAASADAASADASDPDPTWDNFADSFVTTYCHECHGPGDILRDYSLLSVVQAESTRIRAGVDSGQFPIGGGPKPTREDRDLLLLWIDNGAPN